MALKISSTPEMNINMPNILKIEKFLHDSAYSELIELSSNFNTRLCVERKLRMPFLDPQTGVAQNHSNLFMKKAERMPGMRDGQIYTYPSLRWRKAKRQYLTNSNSYPWNYRPFGRFRENDFHESIPVSEHFAAVTEDSSSFRPTITDDSHSKDSHKDDGSKGSGWYYDEMDMHEMDNFDEPEEDSDDDFIEPRSGRKKRSSGRGPAGSSRRSRADREPEPNRRGRGRGRGKKPNPAAIDNNSNSSDKFSEFSKRRSTNPPPQITTIHNPNPSDIEAIPEHKIPTTERGKTHFEDERGAISTQAPSSSGVMQTSMNFLKGQPGDKNEKPRASPSPYCDFCLGDTKENKKTGFPEELVSCSDCGRSGHPTCLQFTENMIISVKKYRWQCIECKCCSICGTSENDETLLFCDSCDAGK